ncbi:MAG TPA: energy transducer TonB [Sphingomicrobium sp.]|nr:energy transducer TonB [Sphingomicrobium sp.]
MLAYAANRPAPVERRPYPNAMLVIIAIHVAGIAAVMSAKMDLPPIIPRPPIDIFDVPRPTDPPPPTPPAPPVPRPTDSTVTNVDQIAPLPVRDNPDGPTPSTAFNTGTLGGGNALVIPEITPLPKPYPVKLGAQLLTSGEELKPPYPSSKLITEEEASLTLRLTIDERGRVIAVEPVGRADPVFLAAARRHLLARWRYKPASEDGRAIASTAVITLRFQLDG